ncbi:hypothetical protein [Pseudomonas cichorii]|uniref:hypothetical protein n=1 Tax=Pseudomonas cichorii TaxID=36746 RepID=UPI001C8A5117|nr:hypothetical protein [Pseudomonas cichorii]MBX8495372.1 hypothetical protein [Pseudomonas cichorii]
MATKVGASLWVPVADQQRAPIRETQAREFERKIGLRDHSTAANENSNPQNNEHSFSEQRFPYAEDSQAGVTRTLRRGSGDDESKAVGALELYALGMHAGRHLSYLPNMFPEELGISGIAPVVEEYNYSAALNSSSVDSATFLMPSAFLIKTSEGQSEDPVGIKRQEIEVSTNRQLLSYFSWRWPDRHFQFLPRGKGLELLVRDYQLTSQERDELIDELSRRALSMPERPQQIWLNGEEVWRASSPSIDYKGENDGR